MYLVIYYAVSLIVTSGAFPSQDIYKVTGN